VVTKEKGVVNPKKDFLDFLCKVRYILKICGKLPHLNTSFMKVANIKWDFEKNQQLT
jgi:hypothetical protein